MSSFARRSSNIDTGFVRGLLAFGLVSVAFLGGCSADLGRFDSLSLNGDGPKSRSAPIPHEPLRRNAGGPVATGAETEPSILPPPGPAPVRQSGLPEPIYRDSEPRRQQEPLRREPVAGQSRAVPAAPATAAKGTAGRTAVEVQQGDTLYGIAKQHKVAISELMSANNLQSPTIRPGQRLVLPAGRRAVPARQTVTAAKDRVGVSEGLAGAPVAAGRLSPAAGATDTAAAPTDWHGSHTVTPRDSLYVIARQYKVKVTELQEANGISDPTKLRAGTVLKVPGGAASQSAPGERASAGAQAPQPLPSSSAPVATGVGATTGGPKIINSAPRPAESDRVAAVAPRTPVVNDATPEASPAAKDSQAKSASVGGPGKFRWPAKGRVVAKFGPRSDSSHNDGINILVPQGTDVLAAESGTVAYAGSELKGYGNLLLIRHEGNWVTAYAHNETLIVKRGDKVSRGQAIAKAGKTGSVDQPQVHFELRQGSKPIDPMPHLEK